VGWLGGGLMGVGGVVLWMARGWGWGLRFVRCGWILVMSPVVPRNRLLVKGLGWLGQSFWSQVARDRP
jgi:hypothetical protein